MDRLPRELTISMNITPRQFWMGMAAVAAFFLLVWEPQAARGVVATVWRLVVLGIAAAFAYQSFDAFRSSFTGTQPTASAPEADPTKVSARVSGLIWGLMSGALALLGATWALGFWGPFS